MKKIGIDSISYYVPNLYVSIENLAIHRNIEFGKLSRGLGLNKMSIPDCNEDVVSFAANALIKLIKENNINPQEVGRIYIGTESSVDGSKPISSYVIDIVETELGGTFGYRCFRNCDIVDMTFACIGAIDAFQNCIDWIENGINRNAIVIASDLAKYDLKSTGEYTQGAGALAISVKENPKIISIQNTWGISTKSEGDFFKPRRIYNKVEILIETALKLGREISIFEAEQLIENDESDFWSNSNYSFELFKEEPVFNGPFSNQCYQERVTEALNHFISQKATNVLDDWDYLVFHLPYAFHARRIILQSWINWLKDNGLIQELYNEIGEPITIYDAIWLKKASNSKLYSKFISNKIEFGEKASSEIGNMYCGSIFMSLLSLLICSYKENISIENKKIGFICYGSGSKSKVFEGVIEKEWSIEISKCNLFEYLNNRLEIPFDEYEKLHKNKRKIPIDNSKSIRFSHFSKEELGLRKYCVQE